MSENVSPRTVLCVKLGRQLEGLEKPPFKGPIGQQIFEKVSKEAWRQWKEDMQIKVLNEYRLNLSDSKDYQVLVEQMLVFLNLKEGVAKETENAARGRGE